MSSAEQRDIRFAAETLYYRNAQRPPLIISKYINFLKNKIGKKFFHSFYYFFVILNLIRQKCEFSMFSSVPSHAFRFVEFCQ